jgi:hypothetical protein
MRNIIVKIKLLWNILTNKFLEFLKRIILLRIKLVNYLINSYIIRFVYKHFKIFWKVLLILIWFLYFCFFINSKLHNMLEITLLIIIGFIINLLIEKNLFYIKNEDKNIYIIYIFIIINCCTILIFFFDLLLSYF